jgi:hypothetical protein
MAGNQYSNAPNWKPTTIICKVCGIEKRIRPCHINKTKYCSKQCYTKNLTGKPQPKEHVEKRANSNRGQKRSLEIRKKLSEGKLLDKNPMWKGGISKQERYAKDIQEKIRYGRTKKELFKIFGDYCNRCKITNQKNILKFNKTLSIHHKDESGRKKLVNNNLNNLEVLCEPCHHKHHLTKEKAQEMNRLSRINR